MPSTSGPPAPGSLPTRGGVLNALTSHFRSAGLETPLADARLLIAHALDVDRLALHTDRDVLVSGPELRTIEGFANRRLAREPVSRIIGERWFYGRPFQVTPATLDPRPDSETLIDAALKLVDEDGARDRPFRILDIGTGTGCLLLTLLSELPNASGLGTDISAGALETATGNARDLWLLDRAIFRQGADFDPVDGQFDLIVSNPPYIPSNDIASLAADVRNYDPLTALDGGPDGLAVYRRLSANYSTYVSTGWVILEVGDDQADAVSELFAAPLPDGHLPHIKTFQDLAGHMRCVAICARPLPRS